MALKRFVHGQLHCDQQDPSELSAGFHFSQPPSTLLNTWTEKREGQRLVKKSARNNSLGGTSSFSGQASSLLFNGPLYESIKGH